MANRVLPIRISALIAAYALVLHAVLAGMAPAAHSPGDASLAKAIICTASASASAGQPAGQDQEDHSSCVLHCVFAGNAMDAGTPAVAAIIGIFSPNEIRVLAFQPVETLGRMAAKNPQIPRAPPLA